MPLPSRSPSRATKTRRAAARTTRSPSAGAVAYPDINEAALPLEPLPPQGHAGVPAPRHPNVNRPGHSDLGSGREKSDPPIETHIIPNYDDRDRTRFPRIQIQPIPDSSTPTSGSQNSRQSDQKMREFLARRAEADKNKSHADQGTSQTPVQETPQMPVQEPEEGQPVIEQSAPTLPNYSYGTTAEYELQKEPIDINADVRLGTTVFPHFAKEQAPMTVESFEVRLKEQRLGSSMDGLAEQAWPAAGPEDWMYECCSRGFFRGPYRGRMRLVAYAIIVMLLAMAGARFGWKAEFSEITRRQGQHDQRLGTLERQVDVINERLQLHSASLQRLEDLLPQQIVLVRRADGKADIDPLFWHALKEKLQAEQCDNTTSTAATNATASNDGGDAATKNTAVSPKPPEEWRSQWEQFLDSNSRRVEQAVADAYEKGQRERFRTPRLGRGQLLTKPEFMAILESKYAELTGELARVGHGFDERLRQLQQRLAEEKAEQEAVERASAHMHASSSRSSSSSSSASGDARYGTHTTLAAEQLEALAQLAVVANMVRATEQVNWLNPLLGAFIDPRGTSPPWQGRSANVPLMQRVFAYFGHPLHESALLRQGDSGGSGSGSGSFSPLEVLQPWDEAGQCWCTPAAAGVDARITAYTARAVYLAGVTLEHAPARMTPDGARSAPRRVSLWVHTPSVAAWQRLLAEVKRLGWSTDWAETRRGWAPAAHFKYDVRLANYVQTFPVALDLRALGVPVDQVFLRLHDNWGDADKTCLYRIRAHGDEVKDEVKDDSAL